MRLSSLYTNEPVKFTRINFNDGLNVIKAEIRLPENLDRDTHNLGKTTFGDILDFCLINKSIPKFIKNNAELFDAFVFFLEIKLNDNSYLTLKRSLESPSKISFKKHTNKHQDFSEITTNAFWDHEELPYEKAKATLDAYLNFQPLKPWDYRNLMGYLIRSQNDYSDIFVLNGKSKGKDRYWKPFLAHILGYASNLIEQKYELSEKLEELKKNIEREANKLGIDKKKINSVTVNQKITELNNTMVIINDELSDVKNQADQFNFEEIDRNSLNKLINQIDKKLAAFNEERYVLLQTKQRIEESLVKSTIDFDPSEVAKLFDEVDILFPKQLVKDFDQLIQFNKDITSERNKYLKIEIAEVKTRLEDLNHESLQLNIERSNVLKDLASEDIFEKYKFISQKVNQLELNKLKVSSKLAPLDDLLNKLNQENEATQDIEKLVAEITDNVRVQNASTDSKIRQIQSGFNKIVNHVIDEHAYLGVHVNEQGNLQFNGYIKNLEDKETQKGDGHSYKKFLCVSFDLSLLKSYKNDSFARFSYHDSVFDGFDDRKKEKLLLVLREMGQEGLQPIVSLIDSEIPADSKDTFFYPEEIILTLHDDGMEGRLFKMDSW